MGVPESLNARLSLHLEVFHNNGKTRRSDHTMTLVFVDVDELRNFALTLANAAVQVNDKSST
jgi:hypothetical protein